MNNTIQTVTIGPKLGNGAFGTVYLGTDLIQNNVAVKVFERRQGESATNWDERKKALIEEGQLLKSAEHNNVVPVYHVCEENDIIALVMKHCADGCVGKLCATQPVVLPVVRQIITDVSLGLQAVHGRGMIHRDIKPANILIAEKGRYYLGDFGCVTQDIQNGFAAAAGYVQHLAPECFGVGGVGGKSSVLSDIWSLGITAYRLMNSDLTWNAVAGSAPGTVPGFYKHLLWLPHIPSEWVRFVNKCIKDDPDQRFKSAEELIDSIAVLPLNTWECEIKHGEILWQRNSRGRIFSVHWINADPQNHSWIAKSAPAKPPGNTVTLDKGDGLKVQEARMQLAAFFASPVARR